MACVLIGGKIEDDSRPVRQIVLAFHHLFRRRRLQLGLTAEQVNNNSCTSASPLVRLSNDERENVLRSFRPSMNPYGQIYQEYHRVIITTEQIILRSFGFTLYWIPHSHPHSFLLYFCKVLELQGNIVQKAWNYCNDSTLLDLCVRYDAQLTVRNGLRMHFIFLKGQVMSSFLFVLAFFLVRVSTLTVLLSCSFYPASYVSLVANYRFPLLP